MPVLKRAIVIAAAISIVAGLNLASLRALEQAQSAKSPTCNEVAGKTAKDVDVALKFCSSAMPKDLTAQVQGVIVLESLLWVKVSRTLADALRGDRLTAEQVIKNWMNAFRTASGLRAVSVTVEWGNVEVAKGETTVFSGDVVTIK